MQVMGLQGQSRHAETASHGGHHGMRRSCHAMPCQAQGWDEMRQPCHAKQKAGMRRSSHALPSRAMRPMMFMPCRARASCSQARPPQAPAAPTQMTAHAARSLHPSLTPRPPTTLLQTSHTQLHPAPKHPPNSSLSVGPSSSRRCSTAMPAASSLAALSARILAESQVSTYRRHTCRNSCGRAQVGGDEGLGGGGAVEQCEHSTCTLAAAPEVARMRRSGTEAERTA